MGDRRGRIDLVQGDAKRIDVVAVQMSPTAGPTAYNLASIATAFWRMRRQPSEIGPVEVGASVVSATAGLIAIAIGTQHVATPGDYLGELVLDFGPGIGRETVPKDNPFEVNIRVAI